MQTRPTQGSIQSTDLPDLLLSLQASSRTGRLRLEREGVSREIYLKAGLLVAADSSARDDALDWMLFSTGALTEERHAEVRALIEGGERAARALVETGSVSPVALCEWTERRARYLAGDVLTWKSAVCEFDEGMAPPAGSIAVRVSPAEILLAALRGDRPASTLASRLPSSDLVLESAASIMPGLLVRDHLLAHEAYVLSLADGRRQVAEICFLSEIGEAETLRTLALLTQAGCLRMVGVTAAEPIRPVTEDGGLAPELPLPVDLPAGDSSAEIRAVIRIYNELYSFIYAHMIKEVGPIAEQLLEKHLREVRDLHAALFNRIPPARDGCLQEDTLIRNVNRAKDQNRRDLLVSGMHDYLRAMVLAVRRILGTGHEGQVVRRLRELRCGRV